MKEIRWDNFTRLKFVDSTINFDAIITTNCLSDNIGVVCTFKGYSWASSPSSVAEAKAYAQGVYECIIMLTEKE